jgi:hypothetical protein
LKSKTKTKALSWLLCLAMLMSLVAGMSLTAQAAAERDEWSNDKSFTAAGEFTAPLGVDVTADITLTLGEGVKLTVSNGINANGHTLTIEGKGTLVVTGTNGNNGKDAVPPSGIYSGEAGGNGSVGINGNIIVTGGTVTVSGGNGGNGGYDETTGRAGGNGGNAIQGNVTVTGGSITVTGGKGGAGGTIGGGGNANNGSNGKAVTGTITGIAEESDNNSTWSAISGTTSNKRYIRIDMSHDHDFTYSSNGATITATCSADKCPLDNSKATLTLKAPENLIADGTAKAATIEGEIPNVEAPEIVYKKNGSAVNAEDVKEEGSYTASITLDDATASIDFAITAPYYTITIPAKLDAANPGWNETAGISASGAIAEGKKLTVTATSANDWALKNGENTITYYLSAAEGGDATTAWEFTDDELAANTTKPMGAVVEEYINKPAGNYTDTVTFTATVDTEKTITIGFNKITDTLELTYADGDTWEQIVNKNAEKIKVNNNNVMTIGKVKFGSEGLLYAGSAMVKPGDTIDPSANYLFRHLG